jgi:hypothetical protein
MILYHSTRIEHLESIAKRGLLPHVPGEHHDEGHPAVAWLTCGKPVVWLTSDPDEWNPPTLSVRLEPNSKRLSPYWQWRMTQPYAAEMRQAVANEASAWGKAQNWFVYFGIIHPSKIVAIAL